MKSGKNIEGISNAAMEMLMRYAWPGNVRELKSTFEYAFVTCQESIIQPHHLPPSILHDKDEATPVKEATGDRAVSKKKELVDALKRANGNQTMAARILGVSRVTVWNRMKKYGINLKKIATS